MLKLHVRNEVSAGVPRNRFVFHMQLLQWVIISTRFDANIMIFKDRSGPSRRICWPLKTKASRIPKFKNRITH